MNKRLWLLVAALITGFVNAVWIHSFLGGGYIAMKEGTRIYGMQALLCIASLIIAWFYSVVCLFKAINLKTSSESCNMGIASDQTVLVKNKNISLFAVQSLSLVLEDQTECFFFCSDSKIASLLLNDFKEGEPARLKINNSSDDTCELVQGDAFALGSIRGCFKS